MARRYYACEALYNVSKVARDDVLPFFNRIFDGLSKVGCRCPRAGAHAATACRRP